MKHLTNKILFKTQDENQIKYIIKLWEEYIDCKFMETNFEKINSNVMYMEFKTLGNYGTSTFEKINKLINNKNIKSVFYKVENYKVQKVS